MVEDLELDGPGEGELLVELVGAGLCHSDLSTINGSRMLTALRAPGQVETRWLTEDIPFGLATWALLGGAFTGRALGAHAVKGREAEIQLYAVEGRA